MEVSVEGTTEQGPEDAEDKHVVAIVCSMFVTRSLVPKPMRNGEQNGLIYLEENRPGRPH